MRLSDREKRMLDGEAGEAVRLAMSILVEIGEAVDAAEMVPVVHVHTDSGFYLGDAGLDFVEHLAALKARVAVPTTMNNTSFDLERGLSYGVDPGLFAKVKRIEKAHLKLGAIPTWTCAPYQEGIVPRFGSPVAWSESNAIAYVNSVVGARTNRTGDVVDILSAVAGRCPKCGLYEDTNRKAEMVFECGRLPADILDDPAFYPLLGYLMGDAAGEKVVAVTGIPATVSLDRLKGLGAAAAASGSIALFHVVGVTPEARTLGMCLKNDGVHDTIAVTRVMLRQMEEKLWTAVDEQLDWIGLGCPHYSFAQCSRLAALVEGKKIHPRVAATVFTSRSIHRWIRQLGILDILTDAGITVYTDGCLLLFPQQMRAGGIMMTDSAKAANYIYSQAGLKAAYGSLKDCVDSALAGKIIRRDSLWRGV